MQNVLFLYICTVDSLLTDISLRQTPGWNENLELVPAFLYAFWLTLYKTDISLSQTHMPVLKVSILETVLFNRDFFAYVFKKQTNKNARSLLTHQINVISCCLIKKEKIFFCPQNLIRTKTEVVFIYQTILFSLYYLLLILSTCCTCLFQLSNNSVLASFPL